MLYLPQDIKDKIEGAFYLYFTLGPREIMIGNYTHAIPTKTVSRPLAWERKMLLILSDSDSKEDWLDLVDELFIDCNNDLVKKFILFRYGLRMKQVDICFELAIEKTTFYAIRSDLIFATVLYAIQNRVISLDFGNRINNKNQCG